MRQYRRPLIAILMAFVLLLTLAPAPSEASTGTYTWSAVKTVKVGDADGWISPALYLATGRTGLDSMDADLVVSQDLPNVYLTGKASQILDLGKTDFAAVQPMTGTFVRKVKAVAGHVYLVQNGELMAKVKVARVIPGEKQYSLPTVYLQYATAEVPLDAELPEFTPAAPAPAPRPAPGPAPTPAPAPAEEAAFAWNDSKTVRMGDDGGWISPALYLEEGRLGLETSGADLVVSQNLPDVFLTSRTGQLLDLGKADYDSVPPLSGKYVRQVKARTGHVYLLQVGEAIAKVKVLRVIPGEKQFSMPTVYLKYAWGTLPLDAELPDAATWTPGQNDTTVPVPAPAPEEAAAVVEASVEEGKVALTWAAPKDGAAAGYYVYRGNRSGFEPGAPLTDFPLLETSFADETAMGGATYYYVVVPVGGAPFKEVAVTLATKESTGGHTVAFQVDNILAEVDGRLTVMDVAPHKIDDVAMVPLRFLAESLGAEVLFEAAERKVTVTLGDRSATLWLDDTVVMTDSDMFDLVAMPALVQHRVLVPVDSVQNLLGVTVETDVESQITIVRYTPAQ